MIPGSALHTLISTWRNARGRHRQAPQALQGDPGLPGGHPADTGAEQAGYTSRALKEATFRALHAAAGGTGAGVMAKQKGFAAVGQRDCGSAGVPAGEVWRGSTWNDCGADRMTPREPAEYTRERRAGFSLALLALALLGAAGLILYHLVASKAEAGILTVAAFGMGVVLMIAGVTAVSLALSRLPAKDPAA